MPFDPNRLGQTTGFNPDRLNDIPKFNPDRLTNKFNPDRLKEETQLQLSQPKQWAEIKNKATGRPSPVLRQGGTAKYEIPIDPVDEMAFAANRALLPELENVPKDPKNLSLVQPETLEKLGVPFPEFVASFTDPATYAYGMLLGPLIGAPLKAAGKFIGSKAVKPVMSYFAKKAERKAIGNVLSGTAKEITKDEAQAILNPKPIVQSILPEKPIKMPSRIVSSKTSSNLTGKIIAPEDLIKTKPSKILMPSEVQPIVKQELPVKGKTILDSMVGKGAETLSENGNPNHFASSIRTELIDKYTPLYLMAKKAEEVTGKVIPFEENPYKAARLYAGVAGKIENKLDVLRDILSPVRGQTKSLELFMTAQRVIEREARGFGNPGKVTGRMAVDDINKLRLNLSSEKMGQIEETATRIRSEIGDDILNSLQDSGIISREAREAIKANNEFWMPFDILQLVSDNDAAVALGGKALAVNPKEVIASLKGTTKKMREPLEALVSRMYKVTALSERNKVIRKIANMSELGPEMNQFIIKDTKTLPIGFKSIPYFDNGIKKEIGIPTAVADAVTGLNSKTADILTKKLGAPMAAGLRMGATGLNLNFILASNPIRDFKTAAMTTGKGLGFIPDYLKGMASALGHGKDFVDYQKFGGMQSGFVSHYNQATKSAQYVKQYGATKFLKTVGNPIELLKWGGNVLEAGPRIGAYKVALNRGASKSEAAFMGRNATVDFSRSGTTTQLLNMWVPFLNARGQGTLILGKAFKDKPAASVFNGITMSGLPQYLTTKHNIENFPEVYDDIPDYVKESYHFIITGTKKDKSGRTVGTGIKFPKSDIDRIFSNPIEFFLDYMHAKGKSLGETTKDILSNKEGVTSSLGLKMASDISPVEFEYEGKLALGRTVGGLLPPPIRGVVEWNLGRNLYFQSDNIPRRLQKVKSKKLQFIPGDTPKALIYLGDKLDMSPIAMENFLTASFGTGAYQILEPHKVGGRLKEKFTKLPLGKKTNEIYKLKEEDEGTQNDLMVAADHSLYGIIAGNEDEKTAGRLALVEVLKQVSPSEVKPFLMRRLQYLSRTKMDTRERAWKSIGKKQLKRISIQEMKRRR